MRTCIYIFLASIIIFGSCEEKKKSIHQTERCASEYIWINYVGITNKIKKFILIRTCEKDTSYYSIYKKDWSSFFDDEDFFDIYCDNLIIDTNTFKIVKEYIKLNNTDKQENIINTDNYSAIKINFADKKDSLTYIINEENADFFEKLKSLLVVENDQLINSLKYYDEVLNSNKNQ